MSLPDRIVPLCDLLLGAAYADEELEDREREEVREMLADLLGAKELPPHLSARIDAFDPSAFDLGLTAAAFHDDSLDDKRRVLFLVAAVHDADEEVDFAEDAYLRSLANALEVPPEALEGLTLDVEVDELRDSFERVRKGPPPPPGARDTSVDVDID